jgi:hypothetical protein
VHLADLGLALSAAETLVRLETPLLFLQVFSTRALKLSVIFLLCAACELEPALAWVFPEHRDITALAIERLDSDHRTQLEKLWLLARTNHEGRLCEQVASVTPQRDCLDYAAWSAISGDHSCSARDMLNIVLNAPWILRVSHVSDRLRAQLAAAKRHDQRVNAVRDSNLALLRADLEYVNRAISNNAHFLLARPSVSIEPEAYARLALGTSAELNALGTYDWFHLRALELASRIAHSEVSADSRTEAVRAALADEAFALHFLEDSFAAGHVVGNWGNSAVRKGTHDYYGEHGVALASWNGQKWVALGDSFMRQEDEDRTAAAVRDSLAQLLDAFAGKVELTGHRETASTIAPEGFDVCHEAHFPPVAGPDADVAVMLPIIAETPVPALGAGIGELPRFRAELGPFVGVTTAVRFGVLSGGFATTQNDVSSIGGLEANLRVGMGLEGVLNESSDGLLFAEFGVREDKHASGVATVPGRGAINVRFRAPFWLIPGDIVVLAPALGFTSKPTLKKLAVQSVNGGLIPWQAGIATRVGRFQAVLGREVGISFYHNGSDHPLVIPTPNLPPSSATLITLNSMQFEFPILEWRLFRTFSLNQSSGLMVQPYVGFDKPTGSSVVSPPGAPSPQLHTITTAGIRVVFDWRHYP